MLREREISRKSIVAMVKLKISGREILKKAQEY